MRRRLSVTLLSLAVAHCGHDTAAPHAVVPPRRAPVGAGSASSAPGEAAAPPVAADNRAFVVPAAAFLDPVRTEVCPKGSSPLGRVEETTVGQPKFAHLSQLTSVGRYVLLFGSTRDAYPAKVDASAAFDICEHKWLSIDPRGAPEIDQLCDIGEHNEIFTKSRMYILDACSTTTRWVHRALYLDLDERRWHALPDVAGSVLAQSRVKTRLDGDRILAFGSGVASRYDFVGGVLDTRTDQFVGFPTAGAPSGGGAVITSRALFVAGDCDKSGWVLDPNERVFRAVATPPPALRRRNASLYAVGAGVLMLGGYGCGSTPTLGARYDPLRDVWEAVATPPDGAGETVWRLIEARWPLPMYNGRFWVLTNPGLVYDAQDNRWFRPREQAQLASLTGRLTAGFFQTTTGYYDPWNDRWEEIRSAPFDRETPRGDEFTYNGAHFLWFGHAEGYAAGVPRSSPRLVTVQPPQPIAAPAPALVADDRALAANRSALADVPVSGCPKSAIARRCGDPCAGSGLPPGNTEPIWKNDPLWEKAVGSTGLLTKGCVDGDFEGLYLANPQSFATAPSGGGSLSPLVVPGLFGELILATELPRKPGDCQQGSFVTCLSLPGPDVQIVRVSAVARTSSDWPTATVTKVEGVDDGRIYKIRPAELVHQFLNRMRPGHPEAARIERELDAMLRTRGKKPAAPLLHTWPNDRYRAAWQNERLTLWFFAERRRSWGTAASGHPLRAESVQSSALARIIERVVYDRDGRELSRDRFDDFYEHQTASTSPGVFE